MACDIQEKRAVTITDRRVSIIIVLHYCNLENYYKLYRGLKNEGGCQEDIIREYEKLIESPHREEAVAMLEMYCKQLQEQIEKEYKAVDCMDYLIYEIENSET